MIWSRRKQASPLDLIETLIEIIQTQRAIMADLSALTDAVTSNTEAISAVGAEVAALKALHDTNQAAVDALTGQITTNNAALKGLITPPSS